MIWKKLTPSKAKSHKSYGLQGWLSMFIAFNCLLCMIGILMLLSITLDDRSELLTPGLPRWVDIIGTVIYLISMAIFLIGVWSRWYWTAEATAIGILFAFFWSVATNWHYGLADMLFWIQVAIEAVINGLFLWYLFRSIRTNVTLKHRIRASQK